MLILESVDYQPDYDPSMPWMGRLAELERRMRYEDLAAFAKHATSRGMSYCIKRFVHSLTGFGVCRVTTTETAEKMDAKMTEKLEAAQTSMAATIDEKLDAKLDAVQKKITEQLEEVLESKLGEMTQAVAS